MSDTSAHVSGVVTFARAYVQEAVGSVLEANIAQVVRKLDMVGLLSKDVEVTEFELQHIAIDFSDALVLPVHKVLSFLDRLDNIVFFCLLESFDSSLALFAVEEVLEDVQLVFIFDFGGDVTLEVILVDGNTGVRTLI